jgi:protein-S-isoprenylcysteine O-methyltransferase Ste14
VGIEEDRASDRRIMVAFALMLVVEVVLAVLADAGTYPLWVWLILAVAAVLAGAIAWGVVQARTEGTRLWGPRVRPPRD